MKLTLILLAAAAALVGAVALASPSRSGGHPPPDPARPSVLRRRGGDVQRCRAPALREGRLLPRADRHRAALAGLGEEVARRLPCHPRVSAGPRGGPRHSARWAAKLPAKLNQMRGRTTGDSLADIGRLCIVRNTTPNPVDNSAQQPGPQTEEQERREFFTPPPAVPPAAQTEVDAVQRTDSQGGRRVLGVASGLRGRAGLRRSETARGAQSPVSGSDGRRGWAPVWTDPEMGTAVINNSEYPDRVIVPASCRLEAAAG